MRHLAHLPIRQSIATQQFDRVDNLHKHLAFDAIATCHVHNLNSMACNHPQVPAREVVEDKQVDCLNEYRTDREIHRSPGLPIRISVPSSSPLRASPASCREGTSAYREPESCGRPMTRSSRCWSITAENAWEPPP
ncbi:MAG: hypothetical protein F4X92_07675 [Gammaproteobacteria bacterium]|nr:hypothetical protein [Gammaproteobacteria bacterium]